MGNDRNVIRLSLVAQVTNRDWQDDRMDRRDGEAHISLVAAVRQHVTGRTDPLLVALDGRSGAGKSTLADAVRAER